MADPITIMAGVGMASTVASSLIGAYGSMSAGASESSMYQYKAGVAQINKKIAEETADYATYTGEVKAQRIGMAGGQRVAQIKATQGASGLDVNSGTASDLRDSQRAVVQQDEATTRANTAHEAYGFRVKGASDEAESQLDMMAAKKSKTAGTIGALGSLVGGASSVASKWMQAKQTGMFDNAEGYYGGSPEDNPNLVSI